MKQIVFFGTSQFSTIVLNRILNTEHRITAVVTTPDKPAGRHLNLTPNPVKVLAQKHNIPILETMNDYCMPTNDNRMTIGLVAAYGKIIPQTVLDAFGGHIYNIHPSLLPKYRGPSPLQQQILDGITQTGVTIIQLDALMDHGPIMAVLPDSILPSDTWITLGERLFTAGAELVLSSQFPVLSQTPISQKHNEATYTKKLTRQDGYVAWSDFKSQISNPKSQIYRLFRAYYQWPGVWTTNPAGRRVKLISLNPLKTLSQR